MKNRFFATIEIIGINPYIYLPDDTLQHLFKKAGREKGAIPVKGTINGKQFTQTLVKFKNTWRLYINGIMRKAAEVDVGDRIDIIITFDTSSREIPIHPKLKQALKKNPQANHKFATYSPSYQKEINRYLHNIKTEETLLKRIDQIVRHLSGEKVGYFVILRNKAST